MSKIDIDCKDAWILRTEFQGKLNSKFSAIRIKEIHSWYKELTMAEKKKHNTLVERVTTGQEGYGMGFDFVLITHPPASTLQFISIRGSHDGELFFKRPSDCSPEMCERLLMPYITFLYLSPLKLGEDPQLYALVRGRDVGWKQRTSKGNKNRMVAVNRLYGERPVNPNKLLYQSIMDGNNIGFGFDYPFVGMSLEEAFLFIANGKQC